MVLITCGIVLFRYAFNQGNIAIQELVMYFHASIFMLGVAYTMQVGGHVRVDIFYQKYTVKGKAWLDLFGLLFLYIPLMIFIFWVCKDYVLSSWEIFEESRETGGLAFVYLLKSLMIMMPILMLIQGMAELLKQWVILND
jgi:TRAP-type mannitol/chloroaromatic compound transport system permease small subunit